MSEDAIVNWSLPPALADLGRLPVRLLGEDGRVHASGLSGRDIVVPAGQYFVACLLPNGREIVRRTPIDLAPAQRADPAFPFLEFEFALPGASLAADEPEAAPGAGPAEPGGLLGFIHRLLTRRSKTSFEPAGAAARIVAGWTAKQVADGSAPEPAADEPAPEGPALAVGAGPQRIRRPGGAAAQMIATDGIVDDKPVTRLFVVPYDAPLGSDGAAEIEVELAAAEGGARPRFRSIVSHEANMLFEFVEHGLLDAALALGADLLDQDDDSLRGGPSSSLQAVLAGYVLLRANAIERLDTRIARLRRLVPWIPDTRVIQAEALARLGRHAEALDALRAALDGPLPWFRSGISYPLERLRLYLEVDSEESESFSLAPDDKARFLAHRAAFEALGRRLDTTSLFTAFAIPVAPQPGSTGSGA